MTEYKVGDRVTVWGNVPHKITTVDSLKPWRKDVIVTLADGSQWSQKRNCYWDCRGNAWYTGERIEPTESGDAALLRHYLDLSKARTFDRWRDLSDERLHAIAEILRAHEAEQKEPHV